MCALRKSQRFIAFVAVVVTAVPVHICEHAAAPPNCSLVFPSILFLNPCQYVCFERLILPKITVRKHSDGTLCTPAFGARGVGTCRNGTCIFPSPLPRAAATMRPLAVPHYTKEIVLTHSMTLPAAHPTPRPATAVVIHPVVGTAGATSRGAVPRRKRTIAP